MTKDEALKMAIEFLDDVGEQTYAIHGWQKIEKLNKTLNACKEALEQPAHAYNIKPADDYDTLLKQFNSLVGLLHTLETELTHYRKQDYELSKERLTALEEAIESEKEMNAKLTAELSALEQPEQEPVVLLTINEHREYDINLLNIETEPHYQALVDMLGIGEHKLYTHPAQPLSDDEIDMATGRRIGNPTSFRAGVRWAEQAHGIGDKDE
jgi:hypothetical protein